MTKSSRPAQSRRDVKPPLTVGIDLGDRFSHYCVLNEDSEVIEEGRIATTEAALERHFAGEKRMRMGLE